MNVGYCTNIHSGTTFEEVLQNLERFSVPVKQTVSPTEAMGIGLWFSSAAIQQALTDGNWQQLKDFLDSNQLVAHTFNAFPYSNFHDAVVKQRVYQPDWASDERTDYTINTFELMARLHPDGKKRSDSSRGSVSTLPLAWPSPHSQEDGFLDRCAKNLTRCATRLAEISERQGINICLCLEPEPGCLLDTSTDLIEFFENYVFVDPACESMLREHLGVCHDICHSAVMFEAQVDALSSYEAHGIRIGKVQISSALETRFDGSEADRERYEALQSFAEPRYLHQTMGRSESGDLQFYDDLPIALEQCDNQPNLGTWRTHFHVPIWLPQTGTLGTTQSEIGECLDWFTSRQYQTDFEVETYAWEVSPEPIRGGSGKPKDASMIDSIVAELQWLQKGFPNLKREV